MRGWVYVVAHQAMPGYVRVGHSFTDPAGLLAELNALPLPGHFLVLHDVLCENPEQVAQAVAARLGAGVHRHGWCQCAPERAIEVLSRQRLQPVAPATAAAPMAKLPQGSAPVRALVANSDIAHRQGSAPLAEPAARAMPAMAQVAPSMLAVPAANHEPQNIQSVPSSPPSAAVVRVPIAAPLVSNYEDQLAKRREALLERYDLQLRRTMPDSHLWSYFFGLLVTFLVAMELLASLSPNSMFVLATLGAAIGSPLVRLLLVRRHKQSPQYRQLLQQREKDLESLEREYDRRRNFSSRFRQPGASA